MLTKLESFFQRIATVRNILLLLVVEILINAVLLPWAAGRLAAGSGGNGPLDLKFFYTPQQAYDLLGSFDAPTRSFYAAFELSGDIFYPIVSFLLFGALLTFLFQRGSPGNALLKRLAVSAPLVQIVGDFGENLGIVIMLLRYPSQLNAIALVGSLFTLLKWAGAAASVVLLLAGLVGLVVRRRKA